MSDKNDMRVGGYVTGAPYRLMRVRILLTGSASLDGWDEAKTVLEAHGFTVDENDPETLGTLLEALEKPENAAWIDELRERLKP